MNAYEHMKPKQDIDLLCQLAMSVSEAANMSCLKIEELIQSSKSGNYISIMLGKTDYINPKMRDNMNVLKLKFYAFAL